MELTTEQGGGREPKTPEKPSAKEVTFRAPEKPKSLETRQREKLQRDFRPVMETAREELKPQAKKLGENREKRKQALRKILREKVKFGGEEMRRSEAIAQLVEAVAQDDASSEQALVKDLQVTPEDIEEHSEYGWVLAKIVELDGITEETKPFLVTALEAAHRGGPEAKPLLKAIVAKLINLLRRSKKDRDGLKDKAAEILKLIMQAEAGEIPWSIVIEKYGLPQEGDLWERREHFEKIAQGEVSEENVRRLMGVEEESAEDNIIKEIQEKIRRRKELLSYIPRDKPVAEQLDQLAENVPPELSNLLNNASLLVRNPSKTSVQKLLSIISEIRGSDLTQKGVSEDELRKLQDTKEISLMLLQTEVLELGEKFGFSKEEIANKMGIYEKAAQQAQEKITAEIEAILTAAPDRAQDIDWLREQRDEVVKAHVRGEISEEEKNDSLAKLNQHLQKARQAQEKEYKKRVAERAVLPGQLLPEEIHDLRENPEKWIRERLYELEKEKHSTHEPELRNLVGKIYNARDIIKFADASYFLQERSENQLIELKEKIEREIHARIHLHDMRRAMATTEWKNIIEQALHLGTHGLFYGFSVMDASRAFNRFQFLIERKRIVYKDGKYDIERITPGVINKLRREVEDELIFEFERLERDETLATKGEEGVEERIQEIKASVQLGYNLFVATQRQALHVSWGKMFKREMEDGKEVRTARGKTQWLSDPDTHIAALFAFLEFSVEKWELMSKAERQILESIMVYAGEGDRELGRRRINRMLKIKDFFSSGWRHEWIYDNVDKRFGEDRAENFLLGMRLRKAGDAYKGTSEQKKEEWEEKRAEYKKVWEKIRVYRPLELIKHLREEDAARDFLRRHDFRDERGESIDNYCDLEKYLGKFIYPVYEKIYARPQEDKRHIRWDRLDRSNLDETDKMNDENLVYTTIESLVEDSEQASQVADQVVGIMQALQRIGLDGDTDVLDRLEGGDTSIKDALVDDLLMDDTKYEELAEWTMFLDDAVIGDWEEEIEIKDNEGNVVETIGRVSSGLWLEEEGGRADPLPRILGDMSRAANAAQGMVGVAQSKTVEEFNENIRKIAAADAMRGYAGGDTPEIIAVFGGGWLNMARAYGIYNWLGVSGISIKSTSELQKLFGREAASLNTRELRGAVELLYMIMGDLDLVGPDGKKLGTKLKESLGATDFMLFLFQTRPFLAVFLVALLKEIEERVED